MIYSLFRGKVLGHSSLTKQRTNIGDTPPILWRYFNSLLFTENSSKSVLRTRAPKLGNKNSPEKMCFGKKGAYLVANLGGEG